MKALVVAAGVTVVIAVPISAEPVSAAGCGGYVNVFVSGCAPWDNNPRRMPGTPGYVAPRAIASQQQRIVAAPRIVTQPTSGLLGPGTRNPGLIGNDSAGLRNRSGIVSDHGGGLVGNAGGTMRR